MQPRASLFKATHDLDKTDPTSFAVGPFPRVCSGRIDVRLLFLELAATDSLPRPNGLLVSRRDAKLRLAFGTFLLLDLA